MTVQEDSYQILILVLKQAKGYCLFSLHIENLGQNPLEFFSTKFLTHELKMEIRLKVEIAQRELSDLGRRSLTL